MYELRAGTEMLALGKKRLALEYWVDRLVQVDFAGRILPVTATIADRAAVLSIAAKRRGANVELADALIAATAEVHGLSVVTLNRRHFEQLGVRLIDL